MEFTPEQQNELKAVQLDMLRHFLTVCRKLNLTYYIAGGTLLGAIRHKGFIPWDDDIDIIMPRSDYDIFLEKAQPLLPDYCFLQTLYTDPGFPANFAKIRNSNTTFIETSVRNCNMNHGVYIDVFPMDFYPEGLIPTLKWKIGNILFTGRIENEFYYPQKPSLKSKCKRILCKVLIPSLSKALHARDRLIKSIPPGPRMLNCSGPSGTKEIVPSHWGGEGCEFEFEGIRAIGPTEYDKWLTQLYGDYMQLPPVEERYGHHYVDVIDLHTPYTAYRGK